MVVTTSSAISAPGGERKKANQKDHLAEQSHRRATSTNPKKSAHRRRAKRNCLPAGGPSQLLCR